MPKVNLVPITGAQNLTAINDNFNKVMVALDEQVLFRDNVEGEPNQMENDLDMNGKRVYNTPTPKNDNEVVSLGFLKEYVVGGDIKRSMRVVDEVNELPDRAARANKFISFNEDGDAVVEVSATDSATYLRDDLASPEGAELVTFNNMTVAQALTASEAALNTATSDLQSQVDSINAAMPQTFPTYASLRNYTGTDSSVVITDPGIAGVFTHDGTDGVSPDNGGTVIVGGNGRRWKRMFTGAIDVRWFGAKVDGVTDDALAVQSAINSFSTSPFGGYVSFPQGVTCIGSTLNINQSGIKLIGQGYDGNHDYATPVVQTNIKWVGVSGGIMIVIQPLATSLQRLSHNGITALYLDKGNDASLGVDLYSSCLGTYDFAGNAFTYSLMRTGCVNTLGESSDPQFNNISLEHRNLDNYGSVLVVNGNPTANTSLNLFPRIHSVINKTNQAIILNNSDNNVFGNITIYGAGEGGGNGLIFSAGSGTQFARANTVQVYSSNMPVYAQGTEAAALPSVDNNIVNWDVENSQITVTRGAGATCWVGSNKAPTGLQHRTLGVGETPTVSIYPDGFMRMTGTSASIPAGGSLTVNLPRVLSTGVSTISLTPNNATGVAGYCSNSQLFISNYGGQPAAVFWSVEGF